MAFSPAGWRRRLAAGIVERANAMTLATATADGLPSARMVLLSELDAARLHVLHQLRQPLSRRSSRPTRAQPWSCFGASSSARCGSSDGWNGSRRPSSTPTASRDRARLGQGLGIAAESAVGVSGRARGPGGPGRAGSGRRDAGPTSGVGRLARDRRRDRILAGPARPLARPPAVYGAQAPCGLEPGWRHKRHCGHLGRRAGPSPVG